MTTAVHTVFFDRISNNIGEIIADCADIFVVDEAQLADLLWLRHGYRASFDQLGEHQLLNHVPGEQHMTRKSELTHALHAHGTQPLEDGSTISHRDFFQETFRLSDPDDRRAFLAQLPETDSEDNLWIMKPSTLARGVGVKVLWQFDALKKELAADSSKMTLTREGHEREYVIQRYIKNVLLVNGRKSEIRVYFAILSVEPLRVVMFPEGTCRITMQPFKLGDYDNPLIHLTNIFQQKQHPDYDPSMELKYSFASLEKDLQTRGMCGPDWMSTVLQPRLKQCLAYIARAVKQQLLANRQERGICFGLYGADVILDDELNPWITEIQKGPGLSHSDSIKSGIIPPMVRELLQVAFELRDEIVHAAEHGETAFDGPLSSLDRFECVVDESNDGRLPTHPGSVLRRPARWIFSDTSRPTTTVRFTSSTTRRPV